MILKMEVNNDPNNPDQTSVVRIREKFTFGGKNSKSTNSLNTEIDNEKMISSLKELEVGDHIVISVDSKKYCHAIVDNLDNEKSLIDVIYYDDTKAQCSLDGYMLNAPACTMLSEITGRDECNQSEKTDCKQYGVKKSTLLIDMAQVSIYKINYEEPMMPVEKTLHRARKYIDQSKYNVFINNDEHFAIYCKTGKAAKLFIIDPKEISAETIIGKSISEKIVTSLAKQSGQIVLVNTAKHIATKFPRSAISAGIPVAAEAAGTLIGAGIEGVSMSYDIYQKHKELKEGKLNDLKFKKFVARRVTRGTMSVAGGVAGGILGQLIIPIPVVGAVVGSVVGGIFGAVAGHGEGILLGELVEVIDNKLKENKSQPKENVLNANDGEMSFTKKSDSENDLDKDSMSATNKKSTIEKKEETAVENSKFSVIDKLVFKFEKDIFKNIQFKKDKADLVKPEEISILTKDGAKILENSNEMINDEDYEIYVLNDANEIVNNLNVENALGANGSILKRTSLKTFSGDQLPSDLNVFFKLEENN